ncbi:hypothetical protein MGWOODY_Smn445 [hydrothermal vent metagenome]|uniref:Uncharacterized protein n=1 Tax=hydrothermal vent metagenome TaxID=652676 RepID=A0A170PPL6_9ZZZZ
MSRRRETASVGIMHRRFVVDDQNAHWGTAVVNVIEGPSALAMA